jgi:hypothetical protein
MFYRDLTQEEAAARVPAAVRQAAEMTAKHAAEVLSLGIPVRIVWFVPDEVGPTFWKGGPIAGEARMGEPDTIRLFAGLTEEWAALAAAHETRHLSQFRRAAEVANLSRFDRVALWENDAEQFAVKLASEVLGRPVAARQAVLVSPAQILEQIGEFRRSCEEGV